MEVTSAMTDDDEPTKWTADQVQTVLMNPFYTMGPSPEIEDIDWIIAQTKLVHELGAEQYFSTFLALFKECIEGAYQA
ncbi:MAG: hypothetical protein CMJ58_00190 [Planctomycetaceae bacterium]|nr:hypothetical protein [Planctomycetaceae bacterium]